MPPTIDFEPIAFEPEQPEAIDFQVDFEPDPPAAPPDPGAAARREAMNRTQAGVQEVPLATRLAAGAYSGIQKGLYTPDKLVLGAMDLALGSVGAGDTSFGQRVAGKLKAINDRDMALAEQDRQMFGNDPASQLTEGIGRAATELPLYLVPGGGAATPAAAVVRSALAGGVVGGGTQYAQDRGEGKGRAVSALYGLNSGAITALTTRAFGATGAESIFRTEGVQGIRNRLLAVFKDAGMEGAEETVDQVQQDLLERITREPNKPLGQSLTEVLMAGAVGASLGGGVGATVGAADAVGDAREERAANREFDARSQTVAQNKATLAGAVREPIQFVPDDFGQKQQSTSRNPQSASSAGLTQSGAAGATPATPDNQSTPIEQPGKPGLVSGALDSARQASTPAATPDNTPATKADLQALADFIQNGGNNPFATKPASAPADVTEKPAQTATGSNVQTGTEMPVQATPGAALRLSDLTPEEQAAQSDTRHEDEMTDADYINRQRGRTKIKRRNKTDKEAQALREAGVSVSDEFLHPSADTERHITGWTRDSAVNIQVRVEHHTKDTSQAELLMVRAGDNLTWNPGSERNKSITLPPAAAGQTATATPVTQTALPAGGTLPAATPAQGGENANGQKEKGRETLLASDAQPINPPPAAKLTTPPAAIVVKQRGRKRFRIQPRSDGIADVLDAIQEEGGLRSPTAADVADGDYDGFKEAMIGPAALLRRRTEGHHPTDIVKAIQAEFPRIKTSGDLYQAIRDAVAQRDNLRRNGGGAEAQQQRFWDAATAPKSTSGLVKINANQLAIGHTFRLRAPGVSHEELTVTHIDADTGEVQVKDGTSFGVQDLPDGAEIWVQKKGLAPELNPAQVKPSNARNPVNPPDQPASPQPGGKPAVGGAVPASASDPGALRARERLERAIRAVPGNENVEVKLSGPPTGNGLGNGAGRSLASGLQSIADVFGKRIVWFTASDLESGRNLRGFADPSGKHILVNSDYPLTALGTTVHELLHQFQNSNPLLYADFKRDMMAMAKLTGSTYQDVKWSANAYGHDLSDELMCDFAAHAFNDPKFLRDFAARDPGLFRRVVNRLVKLLDRILFQQTRTQKTASEVFPDLQAARDRLARALVEWADYEQNVKKVRAEIDKVNGENKQFSVDASSPFPERPALPRGLPAGEQVQAIKKHAADRKRWEQDVKSWVAAQPENKPLVFEDGPDRVALISRDPAEVGKWRTTRFVNREPSGHLIFASRAEAVLDALTKDGFKTYAPQTRFSTDFDNDLFSAPESVADQKARLDREKRATDERKAKEAMQARAAARLTGKDIDTTLDAFANDATTRLDKSGQGSFFSTDKDGPDIAPNLAGVHNTTAEKLRHMLKMGGMPVPSLAIVRADQPAFESFGNITLVGTPDLVTPSADTKVLNADAYSPRYPTVHSFPEPKSVTAVQNLVQPTLAKLTGEHARSFNKFNLFNESPEKNASAALKTSPEMQLSYLDAQGRMPVFTKSENSRYQSGHDRHTVSHLVEYNDVEKTKFEAWVDEQLQRLGMTEKEKILNGFTPSGNRRYLNHDLDTVVKVMKKGFRDAEGFNYGVGSIRAKSARQFRTLAAIQGQRNKLVTKETMEKVKAEADAEFLALEEKSNAVRKNSASGFGRLDAFSDDLKAMAEGGAENWRYLREQYPSGDIFPAMRDFLDKLKNLPSEYFEAKVKRAVRLDEFVGAVVPDTTPADLITALEKKGLMIQTYPAGDNAARRAAVQKIGETRQALFETDLDEHGPLWRSNMQDALATWQPKGTPQQLLAHLAKTRGAMDEAEWIGLDEFLKDKPSVTKAQVQEFVKANTVDIREAQKSARPLMTERERLAKRDEMARFLFNAPFDDLPMSQRITVENDLAQTPQDGTPKFDRYQLPGGENYRELLLTIPEDQNRAHEQHSTRIKKLISKRDAISAVLEQNPDTPEDVRAILKTQLRNTETQIGLAMREKPKDRGAFRSSHFDEPNILAHVRFNERTDAGGKRVLFIEEVQSDWHQRGRKEGYLNSGDSGAIKTYEDAGGRDGVQVILDRIVEGFERRTGSQAFNRGTGTEAFQNSPEGAEWDRYAGIEEAALEARNKNREGVPDAPFKQTWPMLAMKRMIRYAAEHGFDRIGWTTGDQQAERYDLSKQVDSIRLTKKASGSYTIEVTRNGRSEAELIKDGVKPNDLGDYIGKELASKALAAPEQEEQVFAGDNLRVGGKGMRKFYDEMLPSEVNKFVKKWGGRVGQGIIGKEYNVQEDLDGGYVVVDASKDPLSTSSVVKTFATIEAAEGYAKGLSIESEKVHTLDITPAMRESAMQGMPMFSTDFDPPDVATLDKLKSDITAAEQALKTAVRAAVDPNRAMPRADADQAAALATANLRAMQDEYDKHPDRLRAMPLPELEAHAQATAARLAEIAETPVATGNQLPDDLRGERWRLMREAKRIAAERWNRPEIAADALRKAEKLTDDLRAATKAQDATAMRHAIEELQALQDAEFTQIKPALLAAVRADLEAKGEIKPLAVDKRGRTLADLTDWMKARKLDSPKLTLKERVNLAKRLADEFNAGKDKLTHALVRSRAMWQAFKAQWKAPLKDDSVRSIFKEWHYEKQFSGIETHQFASKLRADIPKKVRRMAISVWLDANGDRGLLTAQKMDVPARFLPVWTAALNLTADEKALAMRLKQDFAQKLADGQLLGLIEKGRDSYGVPQIWEVFPQHGEDYAGGDGKSKRPRNPGAKLDPRDPFFALKRTHDTYFDGIMAGGIPRSLDIADLVGVYNVEFHGALADRSVIKALKDAKMPDNTAAVKVSGGAKIEVLPTGARVQFVDSNWKPADAVAADGRPYRAVDHWALRGWKFAATDAAGNPIMVQGDFLVHPDLYAKIKTQLEGKSALRDPEGPLGAIAHITGGLLKSGAFLKASKFASATFHGATLAEHMMTHAFSGMPSKERLALLNPYVGGVEINPAKDREVANLIRHGMDMGYGGYRAMFEEGLTSHGGIWAHVPGLGDGMAWLSDGMFKEYLPRLKVKLGKAVLHANRARYSSKLTEQQIYELTANQVNAAFGGQNWALLGRSKTFLDVNRLFLTAPDFLLSRAKVVGQAMKPYNREQMLFILAQAALVYGAARIFNLLLDDDPHWEPENALQVIHGGKSWSARFIVNDMLHAVTDPAGFASGRLGPWPRTGFEMITGRDMRTGARKDVPIDTENPAFRAAQIAAVDLAQWLIPVGADGLLPGATGREQTGPGQFALGLVGVGSRRYTAETEMFQLAAKFNRGSEDPRANRQQKMRDDAPKQQSAYRKLDVMLEADDLAGARKEYTALQKDGHTKDAIAARMKAITDGHLAHPFTGSQEREKQFKASLTPEQRMEYERAVALRKERAAKFSRMLQTTQ